LRINKEIVDVSGSPVLAPGDDPLRIGNTSMLTFSPLGSATSGTLYVAGLIRGPQMAIRVFGATGRVRGVDVRCADGGNGISRAST
jgi:hypothetical protein